MYPHIAVKRHRRLIGALIGLLFSVLLFINFGSVFEFVGFTVVGVLVAVLATEICYRIWKKFGIGNQYLKVFGSIIGFAVVVFSLYMSFFSLNHFGVGPKAELCDLVGEKPVENKFTGQCRKISSCGETPWYYREGCSSGKMKTSRSCLSSIKYICSLQKGEKIERPSVCDQQELPEKYAAQNGTVKCPG